MNEIISKYDSKSMQDSCFFPTIQDIFNIRIFQEPLVPVGGHLTQDDNTALMKAILGYSNRSNMEDFSSIIEFLEVYPKSPWKAGLLINLGIEYYTMGRYSKALEAWKRACDLSYEATDLRGKILIDRALGELANMYACLGRVKELEDLLKSVENRRFCGPATEKIASAREGLWNMYNRPEVSFRCGPMALHSINLAFNPDNPCSRVIEATSSTLQGFSLNQIKDISNEIGLNFQMGFRSKGAALVIPSVIHLNIDHFAAITRREGDRFLLQDPTLKKDVWITKEIIEDEASGYFLIPKGDLLEGWREVESIEGQEIWGKGFVPREPDPPGPCDDTNKGCSSCHNDKGLAMARIHLLNVSLNIIDDPIGYAPPVGPEIRFTVRYNQRDTQTSGNFNYSNLGPKWTFDWLAYIKDNPSNPLDPVIYYIMGGGNRRFTEFNIDTQTFAVQLLDQTKLIRTSPMSYEMISPDGSKKIFDKSNGSTGQNRQIFLTQLIDPHGNTVNIQYDDNFRIKFIIDAIGQETEIFYDPTDIFKIRKIKDPFGRFAFFEYESGKLSQITDVIGLTSIFTYDGISDFIKVLNTPYGDTKFTKGESGTTRSLEILYPNGEKERVEFNQNNDITDTSRNILGIPHSDPLQSVPLGMLTKNEFLGFRNTYHWDRQACALAYSDYTKARVYHWLHSTDMQSPIGILESVKEPLEGRVWYDYPGQSSVDGSIKVGTSNKPKHIGRILDDGSTQLYNYEYNSFGHIIKFIDPAGRTFSFIYAENEIDLMEIRQTRAGQNELLLKMTYNSQHLPLTRQDAAGQTTTFTYNSRGQLLTETNAKGEITTYHYDDNGYIRSMNGPLENDDITLWTYDSAGRIKTKTDVSGYTLTCDYDNLDRITKITYPDSTTDEFTYTLLDLTLRKDRAGRNTIFEYNSIRQMNKKIDPLNRIIYFGWCKCGALRSLTDPMGRTTTWRYDIQGRVISKEYADGSKINYIYEKRTSRILQKIDEKLQVTHYAYNRDNTLSSKSYTNTMVATPSVVFNYDMNYSRLLSMTDGIGNTHYDYYPITPILMLGAGQLKSINGPLPNSLITFIYDKLGRRVSISINGVASNLIFDAAGRIESQTNALGIFTYNYDGNSDRRSTQSYPNGQKTEWDYRSIFEDKLLHQITHRSADGTSTLSKFVYGHNVSTGQITSWSKQIEIQNPIIYNFDYDDVNQLKVVTKFQDGISMNAFRYNYDPSSNRLLEQIDTSITNFSYNSLNELTSRDTAIGVPVIYQWDAEKRLVAVNSGNQSTQFTYDGLGHRIGIRKMVNGSEVSNRQFLWCDNDICEERTPTGIIIKRFFEQGVQVQQSNTTSNFFYTRDHLNSILEMTDHAGNVRVRYSYDPFGRRTILEGEIDSDFGFAGMFWTKEVNLNLTMFRAYDPEIGRWLSRDPLENAEMEEGINLFAYVQNDPINRIDKFGLSVTGDPTECRNKNYGDCFINCVIAKKEIKVNLFLTGFLGTLCKVLNYGGICDRAILTILLIDVIICHNECAPRVGAKLG